MKTLETLYQEVLASDELKKGLAEAAKAPEGLEAWICAQGCEATAEEIGAFLKEKQAKTGELTDDELELVSAAGESNSPDGWNREKEKDGERRICGWKQEKYI